MATGGTPAFHRCVLITPGVDRVSAWVEDDYHHMGVTLRHDGTTIVGIDPAMIRAPWTICPGAQAQLAATFAGVRLDHVAARGEKRINCTHLHDMAVIAADHVRDRTPTRYDMIVTDATDGVRVLQISRDGASVLRLVERDTRIDGPAGAAGKTLFELGEWIATLDPPVREAARLLRWAAIIAHGRAIPLERQSDASRMPANCFTFQPVRKHQARRVGRILDFTSGDKGPLESPRPGSTDGFAGQL